MLRQLCSRRAAVIPSRCQIPLLHRTLRQNLGTAARIGNNAAPQHDIVALADDVSRQAKAISDYLRANNYAAPSFAADSDDTPDTPEYRTLRINLASSLEDLQRLAGGPLQHMRSFLLQGYDLAAFQVAFEFKFFENLARDEEISLVDFAGRVGLDVDRTTRFVRMLTTHRYFQETKPGFIAHTKFSLTLHEDEALRNAMWFTLDEMFQATTSMSESLKLSPQKPDASRTPFAIRHGLPMYKLYARDPWRAVRFAKAMKGMTRVDSPPEDLLRAFPWENVRGKVVDIGGGNGHMSISIARAFPKPEFIVQDSSTEMLGQGQAIIEDDVRDRVTYMEYDFFEPQPIKDASVFLLRQITPNWGDREVVKMFKCIVPGLESSPPETPLLINNIILPEPGTVPLHQERLLREIDIIMMVCLAAKQRSKEQLEALLKEADPRYVVRRVYGELDPMGLLEVYLER